MITEEEEFAAVVAWARADVDVIELPDINLSYLDKLAVHFKGEYDKAVDINQGRHIAGILLTLIGALVNNREPLRRAGVATVLRDIAVALDSLDNGFTEPLLSRSRVSPRSQTWVRVRSYGAAASRVLKLGGWTEDAADKWVAAKMRASGYTLARTNKRITSLNVKGWRQKCREAPAGDNLRVIYEDLLRSIADAEKPSDDPREVAKTVRRS